MNKNKLDLKNDAPNENAIDCNHAILSQPYIDKLSYVFPIHDEKRQNDIAQVCYLINSFRYPGIHLVQGKGYKFTIKIHQQSADGGFSSEAIIAQFCPISKSSPFVRIEYNPARISSIHYSQFESFLLEVLGICLKTALETAKITRLDSCINILNLRLEHLSIHCKKSRYSQVVFGPDGTMQTMYLCKSKSNQVTIYDKALQKGKVGQILRLEIRLKHCGLFKNILDLKNPFERVQIYDLRSLTWCSGTIFDDWIRDVCRYRGISKALKLMPVDLRKSVAKTLPSAQAKWWHPEDLWGEHWTAALETAGLLPDQCMGKS